MRRPFVIVGVALAVAMFAPATAAMRGGGGHGMHGGVARGGMPGGVGRGFAGPRGPGPGWHGPWRRGHPRSHVFFGFGFPFFVDPFFYPYYVPYPTYAYPPPPPEEPGYEEPSAEAPGPEGPPTEEQPEAEDVERASYGLVQLKGVPEGASVDLDGRFWLKAERLESRWLALPRGPHTLTVRIEGHEPAERRVEVEPGKTQVVRFGPFERTA